jgi:hypothetical protein
MLKLKLLLIATSLIGGLNYNPIATSYIEDYKAEDLEICSLNSVYCYYEIDEEIKQVIDESIPQMITRLAEEQNFKWTSYLQRLAFCESRFNPNALNAIGNSAGIDRGLYQINSHFHKEISDDQAFNPEFSILWTMDRINKGYQAEWSCDKIIRGNFNYIK